MGWVVSATLVAGWLGLRHRSANAQTRATTHKDPALDVVVVDDHFERPVASRCAYRTHVRGTILVRHGVRSPGEYGTSFEPDLRVRSWVRCGAHEALEWERRIRMHGADRVQLAAEVSRRATIRSRATGNVCRYEPSMFFDGERFTGSWLRATCGGVSLTALR